MRILCATDLLPKSEAAIERAGLLADELGADLTLLHVVVPGESDRALEQTLQTALAHTRSRGQPPLWRGQRAPNVAVRAGNPARIILDTVAQSKARLLVLAHTASARCGMRSKERLPRRRWRRGTAPCSSFRTKPDRPYRRVLLALDLSDASASAIRAAESLCWHRTWMRGSCTRTSRPTRGCSIMRMSGWNRRCATRVAGDARRNARFVICSSTRAPTSHATTFTSSSSRRPSAFCVPSSATSRTFSSWAPMEAVACAGPLSAASPIACCTRVGCDALIVPEGSFGASRSKSVLGERGPVRP